MTNTYIIVKEPYTSYPHYLSYEGEDEGDTGSYEAREDNTFLLENIQDIQLGGGDTLLFDLGNIKTMEEITKCLTTYIKTLVDVIIYVSGNPNDNIFKLDNYQFISSFMVRTSISLELESTISINLNNCSNLTSIDCGRVSLSSVYAKNSGLTGNLSFNKTIKELYLSGCGSIEYLNIDKGGAVEVLDISNTYLQLNFDLTNDIFTEKPTINMYPSSIHSLTIKSLDLTNITYPDELKLLILDSPINKVMDLTNINTLQSFTLRNSSNMINIKFPSNIISISLKQCPNLLKNQVFTIPQSTTFCKLDECAFSSVVYNYDGDNSPLEELYLYNLGNCKSININNANYYSKESKTTFLLTISTEDEQEYQPILDLSSFTKLNNLSITNSDISTITGITGDADKNTTLKTINLSESTIYETLEIDFGNLPSIETLNLSNCQTLKKINDSKNYDFMLDNYGSLKYLYLDGTKLNDINITNTNVLSNLTTLKLPSKMAYLDIVGCKKLNNDYLAGITISGALYLANLGYNYPNSLSNITDVEDEQIKISIDNTAWTNITLNGNLLKNENNIIYIKYNKNLKSISFTKLPPLDEIESLEIDISYNINLKTINGRSDIKDILDFFKRKPIDDISQLDYNLSMNAFKSIDNLESMGIWPQVEEWDGLSGRIYGIPNYNFTISEIHDEYVGINDRSTDDNLIQFSLNNITLWDSGDYTTRETLNALDFGNSLSVFFNIDEDGNVSDNSVTINNTETLIDIIDGLLSNPDIENPKIIYTNSKTLKRIATEYNIPVQMLHITGEDWKPRFVININLVSNN